MAKEQCIGFPKEISDPAPPGSRITAVTVWHGWIIDAIQVTVASPSYAEYKLPKLGGKGGKWNESTGTDSRESYLAYKKGGNHTFASFKDMPFESPSTISFAPDEYITELRSGNMDPSRGHGNVLAFLQIVTNKGPGPIFGGVLPAKAEEVITFHPGYCIKEVFGNLERGSRFPLRGIGFEFESKEEADSRAQADQSAKPTTPMIETGNPADADVMISLNCATMAKQAAEFRGYLNRQGYTTWICLDMNAGASFREEIVLAATLCKVFVPLMNEAWANSKECQFEFKIAQRNNLVDGRPTILPIVLDNLNTKKYPLIHGVMCNTNALFAKPDLAQTWQEVSDALRKSGLQPRAGTRPAAVQPQPNVAHERKGPAQQDLNHWDVERVGRWLDELTLGLHKQSFQEHEIDGPALLEMQGFTKAGPDSLKLLLGMLEIDLGMKLLGHRLRLVRALRVFV
eukprot:g69024.t1